MVGRYHHPATCSWSLSPVNATEQMEPTKKGWNYGTRKLANHYAVLGLEAGVISTSSQKGTNKT
jgi:hypothetical protein